ncbi:DUF4159 domain-containing protein [Curvivirga aplysinae]|uniref:DUF4159 domain-containing protein n=1 Tax=Curvivirga aplysinae TaxID=2529852 RepID=UPI0012BB9853|nr:DUF4159 domain-containing protein [Curvivirga aplysinae]MTI10260.1 DUF4159 domain-containing protein [Curvivirga aplysinae]
MIPDLLGSILNLSFSIPWLLLGLLGLPALWFFLRVTPPPPKQVSFPAIMLLTGIFNKNQSSDKAPWWLVTLRLTLLSALILAFAHPRIYQEQTIPGQGSIVLIIENDWASGQNWSDFINVTESILEDAARQNREIYIASTQPLDVEKKITLLGPLSPQVAEDQLTQLSPSPVIIDYQSLLSHLNKKDFNSPPSIVWLQSGIQHPGTQEFEKQLTRIGVVHIYQPKGHNLPVTLSLTKNSLAEPSGIQLSVKRTKSAKPSHTDAINIAREVLLSIKAQNGRLLGQQLVQFNQGEFEKSTPLNLPKNLVSEIKYISIDGQSNAGSIFLLDDRWRNTQIGILQPEGENGLPLLSESYFLDKASTDLGTVSIGPLQMLLRLRTGVIMMPDAVSLSFEEMEELSNWLKQGGVLIRFAGRNLAHNVETDPLLPTALRHGGRALNGMLQWEKPANLKSFNSDSPLAGLKIPKDVVIKQQVLAKSTSEIKKTSWAELEDGTSLISGKKIGQGWLVLFHTTANAEWSNLALSGIFPKILDRLTRLSFLSDKKNIIDTTDTFSPYLPLQIVNGKGQLSPPPAYIQSINLKDTPKITSYTPPGFYGGQGYNLALNLTQDISELKQYTPNKNNLHQLGSEIAKSTDLKPVLLLIALILLFADSICSLALRGQLPQLSGHLKHLILGGILISGLSILFTGPSAAQETELEATIVRPLIPPQSNSFDTSTGLAYVVTGNTKVDRISHEGLAGLAFILNQRTAIEAANPVGIDFKKSELAFYPLIYWPITPDQKNLSQTEIDNINNYLSFGGSIFFDSRSPGQSNTAMMTHLQRLTKGINIPALVPIETDHVLTKSFYLLQDFPGRWQDGNLWVEPIQAGTADGVSRIMVGQNDWAGAWAMDEYGRPRFPVTPGGEAQREMSYRFGINLMMYMLTGNYKKDQVHIPAILERLGQ